MSQNIILFLLILNLNFLKDLNGRFFILRKSSQPSKYARNRVR